MANAAILGCYISEDKKSYTLTKSAEDLNQLWSNNLRKRIDIFGPIKQGKHRAFYDISKDYSLVIVVGLGSANAGIDETEQINEKKENVRCATACGYAAIDKLDVDIKEIHVDACNDPQSAAEGVHLAAYKYDELKKNERKRTYKIALLHPDEQSEKQWERGVILSQGQNTLRRLGEIPANKLTPLIFVEETKKLIEDTKVQLIVRDKKWAESKGMGLFLSVAQGSDNPPYFLELHYNNLPGNDKPLVYIGKGITFDAGGVSLKPPLDMHIMKSDMGGAANVVTAILTLARLNAAVNIVGLVPLTENTINGLATKPGDVFKAMNGLTVEVINTDAEGRLVLADALAYSAEFNPSAVIDIATLTGAMSISFSKHAYAAWCTKDSLWDNIKEAGIDTGERVWRMPLFKAYEKSLGEKSVADLANCGNREGSSCVAAGFLHSFVTCPDWAHLDIANVFYNSFTAPYYPSSLSGQPMRSIVQVIEKFFKQ